MSKSHSLAPYDLDNFDCPLCNNTGMIWWRDENDWIVIHSKECDCMKRRVAIRRMGKSSLADSMKKFSFENFDTPTDEHRVIKHKAMAFLNSDTPFFLVTGIPGSGKTHLCTAICSEALQQGYSVKYMLWRKDITELKAFSGDGKEFKVMLNQYINVPVLYIDDFFKSSISEADLSVAFQIIDERYRKGNKTIISSEVTPEHMMTIDMSITGRILEKSKGFNVRMPDRNWRLE